MNIFNCVACGQFIGYMNPRQYCNKTYCPNDNIYESASESESEISRSLTEMFAYSDSDSDAEEDRDTEKR